jgi:hypothetical protein
MCAFINCRGDDDVDAKRSRPSIGKTREGPRDARAHAFGWDPISGSHQGHRARQRPRPFRLHLKRRECRDPVKRPGLMLCI